MAGLAAGLEDLDLSQGSSAVSRTLVDGFADIAKDKEIDNTGFFQRESELLDLWDRLNDLKLELEILEAQKDVEAGVCTCFSHLRPLTPLDILTISDEDLEAEIEKAEKECLNARTEYLLRKSVIEDTIIAGPILNAIHAGENASANEQILKPLLDRRDALEIASTNLASLQYTILDKTRSTQLGSAPSEARNKVLAAEVRELAKKISDRKEVVLGDPQLKGKVDAARTEADAAVKQWRTMKNVVSAVIAASGVDWAEDDELRELVLDAEDENV